MDEDFICRTEEETCLKSWLQNVWKIISGSVSRWNMHNKTISCTSVYRASEDVSVRSTLHTTQSTKKKKSKLEYLTMLPWECHLRVMKGRVQVKYLWLQEPILPKVFQEISCVNVFTDSESPKMKSSYRTQGPALPEAADTSVQLPLFFCSFEHNLLWRCCRSFIPVFDLRPYVCDKVWIELKRTYPHKHV